MLKIFADHCVHGDLVKALREADFKVTRALEVSLSKAADKQIFTYAQQHRLILLTFDRGFGAFEIEKSFGVVIIRVERMNRNMIIKRTISFFKKATARGLRGSLFIIEPTKIRIGSKT